MRQYYFATEVPKGKERPRYHDYPPCLFAAKLVGDRVNRQTVIIGTWFNSCNCAACGKPLKQSPRGKT